MSAKASDSRPTSKPRRSRFWRNLFDDPVRKLLALALAILLWIFLDSQITQTEPAEFKLIGERSAKDTEQTEIRDSHIVVKPPAGYRVVGFRDHMTAATISMVEVTFEAPQHQLRNIMTDPGLEVHLRTSDFNTHTGSIMFDRAELRSVNLVVLKAIHDMKPRRVDVRLEKIDEKAVTLDKSFVQVVYPDSKAYPDFAQRLRMDAAMFAPQQITLQGPRSVTGDTHNGAPIFKLDLTGVRTLNDPKVVTELIPLPLENVTIQGGPVTITVPLDPRFEPYEMTVPVLVDTASRSTPNADDFEYDPTIKVSVSVSGELAGMLSRMSDRELETWANRNARVWVQLDDDWRSQTQYLLGTFYLKDTHFERGRHYRTNAALSVQVRPKTKNG